MPGRRTFPRPSRSRRTAVLAVGLLGLLTACGGGSAQQDAASFAGPSGPQATYVLTVGPQFDPDDGPRETVQGGQCVTAFAFQPGDIELGRCGEGAQPTQVQLQNQVRDDAVVATLTKDGVQLAQKTLFPEMQATFDLGS